MNRVLDPKPGEGGMGHSSHIGVVIGYVGVVGAEVGQVVLDEGQLGHYSDSIGLGAAHSVVPPAMELPTCR